jgi:plasmid stabilization system protein ParE
MKFQVVWNPAAKRTLADLWTSAVDQNAVASAADEIDRLLTHSADTAGESRSGTTRILVAHPLAVYFDVSEATRTATVFSLWRWRNK